MIEKLIQRLMALRVKQLEAVALMGAASNTSVTSLHFQLGVCAGLEMARDSIVAFYNDAAAEDRSR